jgi:hypothetical protein
MLIYSNYLGGSCQFLSPIKLSGNIIMRINAPKISPHLHSQSE